MSLYETKNLVVSTISYSHYTSVLTESEKPIVTMNTFGIICTLSNQNEIHNKEIVHLKIPVSCDAFNVGKSLSDIILWCSNAAHSKHKDRVSGVSL